MSEPTAIPSPSAEAIREALAQGGLVDITTTGRRSGQERRIEIAFFNFDGKVYISGLPGERGWYANLLHDPRFTIHLKGQVTADVSARAVPVTDAPTRRAVMTRITRQWGRESQLDQFVAGSPLISVEILDQGRLAA
jgi:deazaflavin-dependent oxidoreductase (nitroreductase family)